MIIMKKIIVVGGGAAGMIAAIFAAKTNENANVTLIEKNEKLGKKIYITGKGRCNLTNFCDKSEFVKNVVRNPKFVIGSIYSFFPQELYDFFEENGLRLKVERGNRVFPVSDKASDVTKTLEKLLDKYSVCVKLNERVESLNIVRDKICGVQTDLNSYDCDSVIVCTGGVSYPLTGSTGDGYVFAKSAGHNITEIKPSLVGMELYGENYRDLQGLSLKNVNITFYINGKSVYEDFGEMLFTHFGVSGPVILSCSCNVNRLDLSKAILSIDLKPALTEKQLDERLIREFALSKNQALLSAMRSLLPKSLVPAVITEANVPFEKKCAEISKQERKALVYALKHFSFKVKGLRPVEEAIVTSGGVNVSEVSPKTMESKLIKGLYFAGEVLDVDCYTGGYNLQTAFSTGRSAGIAAASD